VAGWDGVCVGIWRGVGRVRLGAALWVGLWRGWLRIRAGGGVALSGLMAGRIGDG